MKYHIGARLPAQNGYECMSQFISIKAGDDDDRRKKVKRQRKRVYINRDKKRGRSPTGLSNTAFNLTLVKNAGPNGAAGVYLLRSFELMLSTGHNFAAAVNQHEEMADIIRRTFMPFR